MAFHALVARKLFLLGLAASCTHAFQGSYLSTSRPIPDARALSVRAPAFRALFSRPCGSAATRSGRLQEVVRMQQAVAPSAADVGKGQALLDVAVIGAGPAGLAMAAELGERGLNVACIAPDFEKRFVPNYGVWIDEVEPLGMKHCLNTEWPKATVLMGGADGNRKQVLDRPYGRLDRQKTKAHLMERCRKSGVRLEAGQVEGLEHSPGESAVAVAGRDPLRARMIVDCTGHARGFVEFEDGKEPGYQAAYGIEAKITPGTYPLPLDEMLLMDYRDEHMATPEARAESERVPTFIYCMPTDDGNVFFEETSLIANPPVPFEDLKRRLYERLALWGTEVLEVEEEEFCLIPMGGAMPRVPQRVVGFGGSAGLVHPATGYMVSRTWELAAKTADAIVSALRTNGDDAEGAAAEVWRTMWSERYMRNRDFSAFGGEYLESIGLQELREFFGAFFVLPFQQWGGFLSHRLQEPFERLTFGLGVWSNTSNRVRFSLALKGFLSGPDGWYMLARSVLPLDDGDDKTFPSKESRPDFFKKTL